MNKEEHRFYFSSEHSLRDNQGAFTVNLPFPFQLPGLWKCTIYDVFISLDNIQLSSFYILTDFCETSLVNENIQLPVLKKVYIETDTNYYSFTNPLYIPIKQSHISSFTLLFLDSNLQKIKFNKNCLIECCIHFYKHG